MGGCAIYENVQIAYKQFYNEKKSMSEKSMSACQKKGVMLWKHPTEIVLEVDAQMCSVSVFDERK